MDPRMVTEPFLMGGMLGSLASGNRIVVFVRCIISFNVKLFLGKRKGQVDKLDEKIKLRSFCLPFPARWRDAAARSPCSSERECLPFLLLLRGHPFRVAAAGGGRTRRSRGAPSEVRWPPWHGRPPTRSRESPPWSWSSSASDETWPNEELAVKL